ncbi:hypothetical protein SPRG_08504 [Saprolegnia parasitica CBS 223.65]|uniref:Sulfite exporter TauE/SafE n=1 Tax=Saprolegnia parasitica (strain CBS 223.65) TaxID=695850 RepID=A0A067C6L5_SAPPC|nr:hypothetical protein SPRG_08504 [Saprolegnia parasitica CBS 223.65]KDO26143.1 hypothetical protein SPRG_08504 [Saprolegnia parasitica CBS 223.65]|eukprot:XP_012203137.1 hypothetical protein SPRG_08504 [Saprolegnia parasitica CBS 223.65]
MMRTTQRMRRWLRTTMTSRRAKSFFPAAMTWRRSVLSIALYLTLAFYASSASDGAQGRQLLQRLGQSCDVDDECQILGRRFGCVEHACVEQGLFPLQTTDLYGTIGAFLCVIVSSGGGLGGGGLLVPLYIIVLGMTSHDAIPLSKATIFGSAIASMLLNSRKTHPLDPDRQLIDYEVVVMMEPMTLAGTILGVHMNKMCPEWLITVLLVWLLSSTSLRMITKGKSVWKAEAAKEKALLTSIVRHWASLVAARRFGAVVVVAARKWRGLKALKALQAEVTAVALVIQDAPIKTNLQEADEATTASSDDDDDTVNDAYDDDHASLLGRSATTSNKAHLSRSRLLAFRKFVPWGDLTILFFAWFGLLLFSMLKGGHGAPSVIGLDCGSAAYWLLTALSLPFFVGVTAIFGIKIAARHEALQSFGYKYVEGDIVWTKRTTVLYPALCTIAGVAAGLLGIGGGMVKGPLLLEIGLHPQVASASSSTMILFTSSATTLQFIVLGMLPYERALWYGIVGFAGGVVGQLGLSYLIKKYRKTAFVLFMVAAVIAVSGAVMGVLGLRGVLLHGFTGFHSLCQA